MKPKKQHYVSQFILKNFNYGKNRNIWVFDKKSSKVFRSSVRNSACENYFYEMSDDLCTIEMEAKLSSIEGVCSSIFNKIINEESLANISKDEHRILCLFTTIQHIRTNVSREQLQQMNNSMVSWVENNGDSVDDVENLEKMTEQDIKNAHILNLNSLPIKLVQHFIDKELSLVEAPKGSSFYISDNPIALHNHFPREGRGSNGIGLKGIEIHFPISPKLCLHFFCSETSKMIKDKVKAEVQRRKKGAGFPIDISEPLRFIEEQNNPKAKILNKENVLFHNSLQVIQSSRFLYSHKNNFELVKDMLQTNPEVKYSPRMESNSWNDTESI